MTKFAIALLCWTDLLETNEKMTHVFSLSTLKETPALKINSNVHGNNFKN